MKGLSVLGSRLAVVLAFFSLVLLVIVKEKYFKNVIEKFFGGLATAPFKNDKCGSTRRHNGFRGEQGGGAGLGQDLNAIVYGGNKEPGIIGGSGYKTLGFADNYASVLWYVVEDDMSKPCTKDDQCTSKKCTEFGLCAFS